MAIEERTEGLDGGLDTSGDFVFHRDSRDSTVLSDTQTTVQSANNRGNAISVCMRSNADDNEGVEDPHLGGLDRMSQCFFPDDCALRGNVPNKVVRYALKRTAKAKLALCERARNMTLIRHDQLDLGELLGEGSFSGVYSIDRLHVCSSSANDLEMPDASHLVVKVLRKKLIDNPPLLAACAADIVKEGNLLARLSHENIVAVHAWAPGGVQAFLSGRHDSFFLLLGKLEMTLSSKLSRWRSEKRDLSSSFITSIIPASRSKLQAKWRSFQDRMDVIDGVMEAVTYLHSQGCIHRDLKPDNIGFDPQGVLKIFDFDVARILPVTLKHNTDSCYHMTKRVGSPRYMSPECARGDHYNGKTDVYAVALLVHELVSLEKPYEHIPSELHDDMVFYSAARPPLQPKWPSLLKCTLQQAWNDRISLRPTMREFQASWQAQLKVTLLDDKRKRYHRSFGCKHPSREDSSMFVIVANSPACISGKKIAHTGFRDSWDSARTIPVSYEGSDSCHD